jgi:hypothetical protein
MLAYRNANRAIARLRAFVSSSSCSLPRRAHFIVNGKNHVNIMREAARLVRASGHEIAFVPITGARGGDLAMTYAHELGFPTLTPDELARKSVAGDLICCGSDWGPRSDKLLLSAKQREGVTLVGIIEGARFSPRQFQRVDYILAWGPSTERLWPQPTIVTGSPVFERSLSHRVNQKPSPPRALINYKFQQHESDPEFAWARAAMSAASSIDRHYIVSVHPAVKATPAGMPISQENIDKLLAEASVVITRASTIIHQALALGTTVIFAPTAKENRAEFRDLQGIIHVAETEHDLMRLAREFAAKGCLEGGDPKSFVERHFSIDPEKSADERMANALLKLLRR